MAKPRIISSAAALAICLIYPSTAIFDNVGYLPMVAFVVYGLIGIACWLRLTPWVRSWMNERWGLRLLIVLHLALLGAHLMVHPLLDHDGFQLAGRSFGSSDGDDAIDVALDEILQGHYPYYERTFLNNPITPMPGALVMALPFYLMGESSVQNIAWLLLFFLLMGRRLESYSLAFWLALLVYAVSPNVIYGVLQGGDYLTNSAYLVLFTHGLLAARHPGAPRWAAPFWAVCLGIGLSSRGNFAFLVPLLFLALVRARDWRHALIGLGGAVAVAGVITLPFYFYDPAGFSPLHTSQKLSQWGEYPWGPTVILTSALCLTGWLGLRIREPTASEVLRALVIVQGFLFGSALLLASFLSGRLNLEIAHFGLLLLLPGVYVFAPEALAGLTVQRKAPTN